MFGDRAIVITYLNSACRNTQETQISFQVANIIYQNNYLLIY
jgi:hypothetical protein